MPSFRTFQRLIVGGVVVSCSIVLLATSRTRSSSRLRQELAAEQERSKELQEVITRLRAELDDVRSSAQQFGPAAAETAAPDEEAAAAAAAAAQRNPMQQRQQQLTVPAKSIASSKVGWTDVRVIDSAPIKEMMSIWPLTLNQEALLVLNGDPKKASEPLGGCRRVDVVITGTAHYPPAEMKAWAPNLNERCIAIVRAAEKETGHKYTFVRNATAGTHFLPMAHYYDSRPHAKAVPSNRASSLAAELQIRFLRARNSIEAAIKPVLERAAESGPGPYGNSNNNDASAAPSGGGGANSGRGGGKKTRRQQQQQQQKAPKRLVVTVSNEGHADLLLNMLCSARVNGVDLSNLVVFAAQERLAEALEARGVHSFYHRDFGDMPANSDKAFGSIDFIKIMWLKVLAVFLPVDLGYDVLFLDDDLVFWRSLHHLLDADAVAAASDVVMQDDGSRRNDFAPAYGNTGLYLVRSNPKTRYFLKELFGQYDMIVSRGTHQGAFNQLLDEHVSRTGLRTKTLSEEDLPAGRIFNKGAAAWFEEHILKYLRAGEKPHRAAVLHVNWTGFKTQKMERMHEYMLWHVSDACSAAFVGAKGGGLNSLPTDVFSCCIHPVINETAGAGRSAAPGGPAAAA